MRKVIDLECDLPPDENGNPRNEELRTPVFDLGRDREFADSPLEEAVTSEPVSETRLFPGAFQNQISVGFGCYQQRKAPFASNSPETEPPSLADGLTIAFYSRLYARVRARGQRRKTRYCGPRRAANSSRKRNSPAACTN